MTARKRQLAWMDRWGDLALYNSEVSRGIVHDPEHVERMRRKQAEFDLHQWFEMAKTHIEIEPGLWAPK